MPAQTGDKPLTFFHFIYVIYKQAERATGGYQDRYFTIGDRPVRLRFVGKGLISALTPAISHLEIAPVSAPALTVHLWDSVSSGSRIPLHLSRYFELLGVWWKHLGIRGEIKAYSSERIYAHYHLGPNIFSIFDRLNNLAFYYVKDSHSLPSYEIAAPLRTILHWWADRENCQFIHGGAVGLPSGGALLGGRGGAGKSTTALACLQAGLLYASDDYCLVKTEPDPFVYSLYSTAKLRGEIDLQRFPRLAPLVSNHQRQENDKAVFFLQQIIPRQVSRGFPLKAILLPVVTGSRESVLREVSKGSAMAALAPSTIFQLPGAGEGAFKVISRLVSQVPAYTLELGTDIARIPEAILNLLLEI